MTKKNIDTATGLISEEALDTTSPPGYLELHTRDTGERTLVSVQHLVRITPLPRGCRIVVPWEQFNVNETYDEVFSLLTNPPWAR